MLPISVQNLLCGVKAHYRAGIPVALLVQFLMVFIVVLDLHSYRFQMGLSLRLAVEHMPAVFYSSFRQLAVEVFALGFAIPCLGAIAVQFDTISWFTRRHIAKQRCVLYGLHLFLLISIAFSLVLTRSMEDVAGFSYEGGSLYFLFRSIHNSVIVNAIEVVATGVFFGLAVLGYVSNALPWEKMKQNLRRYWQRSHLMDVGGILYPVYGCDCLDFNAGSLAPEILAIQKRTARLFKQYQYLIPGSPKAWQFVVEHAEACRTIFHELLFGGKAGGNVAVDFLPGTGRALEVALTSIQGPKFIVLSPFEHESVTKVVEWYCRVDRDSWFLAPIEVALDEPWDQQQQQFVDGICSAITRQKADKVKRRVTIVMSEICAHTGQILPIRSLLDAIERRAKGLQVEMPAVILDGAHAWAARPEVFEKGWDERIKYYVVSAHKWLLGPEPCGVLAYRKGSEKSERPGGFATSPYDALRDGDNLPTATLSARGILGLFTALELLRHRGVEGFRQRGWDALRMFYEGVAKKARFVRDSEVDLSDEGSVSCCMVAVRPREGYHWEHGNSKHTLQKEFLKKGVYVSVISDLVGKRNRLWVRVSFSHFIDTWKVRKLSQVVLNEIVPDRGHQD